MFLLLTLFAPVVASVALPSILAEFDRAAMRSGHSKKELACCMGTTPQRLAHMLRGECSALSVPRLLLNPPDFIEAFIEELRAKVGLEKPLTARDVLALLQTGGQKCA